MRGSRSLRAAVVAAALSFTVVPSVAWAGDAALAEQLFSEGLAAMKAERWAAACEAFAGSNQADPSPGTQINLGVCNEKQKKYATALTWFDAAARLADEQNRPDRAKLARTEHDRVAPNVHKLAVVLKTPVEGATISRNGETKVPAAVYAGKETPLDPGKYTFELSARGKKTIAKELSIPETAGKTTLEFPAMEDAPIDKTAPAGGDGAGGGGGVVVADGSGQRTVGIVVGGVGILALLTAGGLQILAQKEESKAKDYTQQAATAKSPNDRVEYESASKSRYDAAQNNQLIAIITGVGGVVLLGVGAVLFFTAPSGSSKSAQPRVLPVIGPGYAGGSFGFSF